MVNPSLMNVSQFTYKPFLLSISLESFLFFYALCFKLGCSPKYPESIEAFFSKLRLSLIITLYGVSSVTYMLVFEAPRLELTPPRDY
jgi:hypothetical protein